MCSHLLQQNRVLHCTMSADIAHSCPSILRTLLQEAAELPIYWQTSLDPLEQIKLKLGWGGDKTGWKGGGTGGMEAVERGRSGGDGTCQILFPLFQASPPSSLPQMCTN